MFSRVFIYGFAEPEGLGSTFAEITPLDNSCTAYSVVI
jgi:hypothetical protein